MTQTERKAHQERIEMLKEQVQAIVNTGICPECKADLKRNLSMTGWWQCEQLGAVGFRKDPTKSSCNWQGFVS